MDIDEPPQDPFEPVAIVGMAALLPDADDVAAFWANVLEAHVSFRDIPAHRWEVDDFWVEGGPGAVEVNKTYSKIGAFVEGFEFDWRRWKQPPGTLAQIDECQLWAVSVAADSLADAGYGDGEDDKQLPNARTGVVFANALGGENRNLSNLRVWADQIARKAVEAGMPDAGRESFKQAIAEGTPKIDEDTMAGELANVVAGRVANLLDLQGPNYSTDAACATTFAALMDACHLLHSRQVDVMLAGASDRTMDPATYAKFSAIGALSPSHSTPFDMRADGFVMGEGAGCVVLKRLSDAIADGDRIYSVIRGIGASSDGRGKGITAPSVRGQRQAVLRAQQQAGHEPGTVELIEAHGTSTRVGDATELNTLSEVFGSIDAGNRVAVGSIKSQIGHLKAAAGIAGLLKAVLALHHRTIPPSAGFEQPNTSVDWDAIPFYVPTAPAEWPAPASGLPRRAGISSFGFGGTNFHCSVEQYDPEYHLELARQWDARRSRWLGEATVAADAPLTTPTAPSVLDQGATPSLTWDELKAVEGGVLLLNAVDLPALTGEIALSKAALFAPAGPTFDDHPTGRRLSAALAALSSDYSPEGVRCAVVASTWAQLEKRLDLLLDNLEDREKWDFLSKQMVHVTDAPPLPREAGLVQMFPGQGSQYVGMTLDLSQRYEVIGDTWAEADRTMVDILGGELLSDFVLREGLSEKDAALAEEKLKQTEFTQPAMLTADLAIHRLLKEHGIVPDMVAGHSLGEYAALMVSGILQFHDALRAVAARGTEMGSVVVPDRGLMASVTAPYDNVLEVIESTDGYVIAANKNSPSLTVIAGETEPMNAALAAFAQRGIQCVVLQTSHAFHSRIVAPANEPLRRFLEGLDISLPKIPITANYDGHFYPNSLIPGQTAHDSILAQLAPQMSSPVEWIRQMETMHEAGGRLFLEVGPKRALSLFADQVLADKDRIVSGTNHPKMGGISTFHDALAICALAGRTPTLPEFDSDMLTEGFRAGPLELWRGASIAGADDGGEPRSRALPASAPAGPTPPSTATRTEPDIEGYLAERVSDACGYPARLVRGELELAALGMTGDSLQALLDRIAVEAQVSGPADASTLTTLPSLVAWVTSPPAGYSVVVGGEAGAALVVQADALEGRRADPYVVTGVSLGLPGMEEVFAPDALERIINGENFISELPDDIKQRILDKNLVRIVKHPDGSAELIPCESFETIPQLAGRGGYFDLAEQYGIDAKIVAAMDVSTKLAFAAGLEALHDAGLPLVPNEQVSKKGKRLVRGWNLPDTIRDRTGVVFASAFAGLSEAMRNAANNAADESGVFDRRFLLQVLVMGHGQFAQWIGARGPNMAINNACASTPAAFAVAEDWISTGRADRVIIISGDDASGDDLMEWLGSGFAAAGAHAMGDVVEETSLPFDARRSGMLMGMGGAAFVIERASHAAERGVTPYAELLGAYIGNSAFHPTRIDVEHVAESLDGFIGRMEREWGLDRSEMAPLTTFMSHEPATPPRGGSAAAEIEALRRTFGDSANELIITNTKGFTGHPMGVGIEDAVVLYGLACGRLPPIANFREPDPELGDLRLSEGGEYEVEYALRHGAGFGSQIALSLFKRVARGLGRIHPEQVQRWVEQQTGGSAELKQLERKLVAWIDADDKLIGGVQGDEWLTLEYDAAPSTPAPPPCPAPAPKPAPTPAPAPQTEQEPETVPAAAPVSDDALTAEVVETVSRHTGYPVDFIELDQDLEGELGIDTVKQAEIMAELRETYSLPVDESFQLRDHPTLNHMIAYIQRMGDGDTPDSPPSEPTSPADPSPAQPSAEAAPVEEEPDEGVVATIIEIVVRHTGYPADFLELDQDLEGELGIDTVKQAEIMGDCRDAFEIPVDESFQLRDHPTLNHMIAYIQGMKGTSGSGTAPDSPPAPSAEEEAEDEPAQEEVLSQPAAQEPAPESTVRRWQVEVEEAEAGEPDPVFLKGSHVLITDDNWGVSEALSHKLEAVGVEAVRLMLDPSIVSKIKVEHEAGVDIIRLNPGNEQQLGQLQEHLGDIDVSGVIHLAPLTLTGMAWAEVTNQAQTTMVAHGFFGILQAVDAHLGVRGSGIICSVSALDGRHGNGGKRFNPLGASAHGIVKSYARERGRLRCRALDVAPEQLTDPTALAQCILDELEQPGPVEVSIDADGRRWQMCLYDEQLEAEPTRLASDDVWVVSGGGSGVTAACIVGLAEANPDVGAHFALLGRTKLDHGVADLLSADEQTLEARKLAVRERMQRESDGGMVTIVEWEREWSKVTRSLDILRTLEAIEASGNHATYHPCNVIRPKHVNRVFSELSDEVGPVTGIVHGAGMEDSKLLGDKGFEMFAKVMAVKVSGWLTLANAALDHDANLRFVCCFTSIAGRFGNAGQVDYAAANCVLDAEMCRLAVSGDEPRAVAIAWSGWRDVGMATRGSIETVFETAGIETIPVEKGVELFVDEVMCGGRRMVVIAGRLGVLDESESTREPPQRLAPDVAGLLAEPARFPFIDRIVEHDPYETLVSECTLDVQQFPFLSDHAIDGTPYLPGVMALEMFAEAAQLLWPACSLSGFDDISFGLPVKLVRHEQKVRTLARFSRQDDAHVWVECTLESDLVSKAGEVFGEPRQHHAGTVRLLKHGAQKPVPLIPAVGLPERGPASLPTSFIYERFFHGPRFQAHGGIIAGSSVNGDVACDGIALMRSELPNGIQFADEPVLLEALPMLIEVGFQNAGMVAMEIDRLQSLPIGIEQVELLQTPKAGGLRVRSVRRAAESGGVTLHDVLIVDANDHPVLALNGVRLKGMAPVEPGMEFKLKRN